MKKSCQCIQCLNYHPHLSDCGVHNNPVQICDCPVDNNYIPTELRNSIGSILYPDFQTGHDYDDGEKTIAKLALLHQEALRKLAKAYGNCELCFGKGFATTRAGTSSRYGNTTHDTYKPCTCSRGEQFKEALERQDLESRLDESKRHLKLKTSGYSPRSVDYGSGYADALSHVVSALKERIAELKRLQKGHDHEQ